MELRDIVETDIWVLYEQCVSFCRMRKMFDDTDLNHRMYNGDQWYGLKVEGVEKIQYNFIKPIVRYKTGVILSNLYAINYSSENFENQEFRSYGEKICRLLNKKASNIWEKDYMDLKLRCAVKDAAINDESILYCYVDEETGLPVNEVLNKTDIFYGNENKSDIQSQPYILIKHRLPVSQVQELAKANGVAEDKIRLIKGDNDNTEEAGEESKYEKDEMCTVITKFYKKDGTVRFTKSTKHVEIKKDADMRMTLYPLTHIIWEERKGSARGEGEVRHLIPNQLEVNKTAMRRALSAKNTAYPQKVANMSKIANKAALSKVGGVIEIKDGMTVDDVAKIFTYVRPAQMSPDVEKLQNDLITSTRELAGAGEVATGQVNPESASGRAILAVLQASQQPLTEHLQFTKCAVEDLGRIWLDILIAYNDSIDLEDEQIDSQTGEPVVTLVKVDKVSLRALQASVKVEITPKSAYDKFAREMSLENLMTSGMLSTPRLPELRRFVDMLPDDSVMPRQPILEMLKREEQKQQRIAAMQAEGQRMQQRAQQFMAGDPGMQAEMLTEAKRQMALQQMPQEAEMPAAI